jgi:hypothetical protein
MTRNTRIATALALAAAALAAPGAALAATTVGVDGDTFSVTGSGGPDAITIVYASGSFTIVDPAGITNDAGGLCTTTVPVTATCTVDPDVFTLLDVLGGDGNDTLSVGASGEAIPAIPFIDGGTGNDKIVGANLDPASFNGEGETIVGGPGNDLVDARGGNDFIFGGAPFAPDGLDLLYGGPGNDRFLDGDLEAATTPNADTLDGGSCPATVDPVCTGAGGETTPGVDLVDYGNRAAAVVVDLSRTIAGGQGQTGENDTIRRVENAFTGSAGDIVRGNSAVNAILTFGGNDLVDLRGDGSNADRVDCGDGASDVGVGDAADQRVACELPAGATTTPPTATPPATTPAVLEPSLGSLRRALGSDLRASARLLGRVRIGRLRTRGVTLTGLDALVAGRFDASITATTRGAGVARTVTLAKGVVRPSRAGRYRLRIRPTRQGRLRLRGERRARLRLTLKFRSRGGRVARGTRTVRVRR